MAHQKQPFGTRLRWIAAAFRITTSGRANRRAGTTDQRKGVEMNTQSKTEIHRRRAFAVLAVSYGLTFGGFLLLGGRAADLLGRRRIFMVGLGVFTAASLACALATTDSFLIVMRGVQGIGAAIVLPAALSIVMNMFPEGAEGNRALGAWGGIAASGATVGLIAGGLLTSYIGWPYIFYLNVPIGALALLAAPRIVPESRLENSRRRYDPFGGLTVTASLLLSRCTATFGATSPFFVAGAGTAFAFIPVSIAGLGGVAKSDAGLASGLLNTSQQIGGAIGVAFASTVATTHINTLTSAGADPAAALTGGFQWALWVCGAIGLAAIPIALLLVRRDDLAHAAPAAEPVLASAG
jgi:MFS family permease